MIGERNTACLHLVVNKRAVTNFIHSLQKSDGLWTSDSVGLSEIGLLYFQQLYQNQNQASYEDIMNGLILSCLDETKQSELDKVIAPNQCAYLKVRLISDNILLVADLMIQVHGARKG